MLYEPKCLVNLTDFPEIQEKIFKEIEENEIKFGEGNYIDRLKSKSLFIEYIII